MTDVNRRVLPGFGLSLGYTMLYLSLGCASARAQNDSSAVPAYSALPEGRFRSVVISFGVTPLTTPEVMSFSPRNGSPAQFSDSSARLIVAPAEPGARNITK